MKQGALVPFLISFVVVATPVLGQDETAQTVDTVRMEATKNTVYGALEIGRLAKGDARLQAGEYRDLYSFNGKAGDPVIVELESEDFDPYLAVVSPSGRVMRNDDWGETSAARIQMLLKEDGPYQVVVTSFRPGEQGIYQLRILDQRVRIAQ
ncbi:MAG: PPC domain-containing protein [Longimicrobiales bacterium]